METFNKCIVTLRNAKSDSEKLAALMVISKISTSFEFKENNARDLLTAVSAKFLARLLKSKSLASEDENNIMLQNIGVNTVSLIVKVNPCLVAEKSILLNELLLFIKRSAKGDNEQVSECLDILYSVSCEEQGNAALQELNIFDTLKNSLYIEKRQEKACALFTNVIRNCLVLQGKFLELLDIFCSEFKSDQSVEKFKYVHIIRLLFKVLIDSDANIGCDSNTLQKCLKAVVDGCSDVLQSKVKSEIKLNVLALMSAAGGACGFFWLFNKDTVSNQSRFILLLLTVIYVEVSCLFREVVTQRHESVEQKKNLRSMFSIMKGVIHGLCSEDFMSTPLAKDSDFIIKAFNCLKNTMKPVYMYLSTVNVDSKEGLDKPLISDSVAMICYWATEETEMLQEELKGAIPLMMSMAQLELQCDDALEQCNRKDSLFDVITPCVSQMLVDEKMRKLLLRHNCVDIYVEFLSKLAHKQNFTFPFHNTIHLLHQLTILEPQMCRENDVFSETLEVLKTVIVTALLLSNEELMNTQSKLELVALTFTLVRMKKATEDLLTFDICKRSVDMLLEKLDVSMTFDFVDMWVIAAQNILDFAVKHESVLHALKNSEGLKNLLARKDGKYNHIQDMFSCIY